MVVQGIAVLSLISFSPLSVQGGLVPVQFPCTTVDSPYLSWFSFYHYCLQVSSVFHPFVRRRVWSIYLHFLPLASYRSDVGSLVEAVASKTTAS
ncbi:hypothetical protein EDD16DRAFT_1599948 [Pisolithus croceorrhizus]|nr:hypothetical protein EDD16DRAFT_1599948 [Pisolithus croceorrhizus]